MNRLVYTDTRLQQWLINVDLKLLMCYERPKNILFISSAMTLNYEPEEEPAKAKR